MILWARYLNEKIKQDLNRKLILISGPRQCGKTTLSKSLTASYDYLNFDITDDRPVLINQSWDRQKQLIIFDELHKMKNWKTFLKGIYDKEGVTPNIIVTGSARLDMLRKTGDSLAGRFFRFRLHPFDLKEIITSHPELSPDSVLDQLLTVSGFPEPFLQNSSEYYHRWRKSHHDSIIRQDLIDLNEIRHISAIETLIELLRSRVGSPISYTNLAKDLQHSPKTIKNWLDILENLYIIFKITPYHRNIARALLKEPKYYFYDTALVLGDDGCKLENLVACSLLKEGQYREDTLGIDFNLHYLRDKQGHEIDFLVCQNQTDFTLIEVKLADNHLAKGLTYFSQFFPNAKLIQLCKDCDRNETFKTGARLQKASQWLSTVNFNE